MCSKSKTIVTHHYYYFFKFHHVVPSQISTDVRQKYMEPIAQVVQNHSHWLTATRGNEKENLKI